MAFEGTWWEGLLAWAAMTASWLSSSVAGAAWSGAARGVTLLSHGFARAVDYMLLQSLRTLYLRGPSWLGFWNGMELPRICDRKTSVGAHTWEEYDARSGGYVTSKPCRDLVESDVEAFQILALTMLTLFMLFNVTQLVFWYCMSIRPLNAMIRRRLRRDPSAKVAYYITRPLHEERRLGALLETLAHGPAWFQEKVMRRRYRKRAASAGVTRT